MAKAKLRSDLRGQTVPGWDVKKEEHTYIDLNGRVLQVYECEKLADIPDLDGYNAIVVVAGECYFINTIEVEFV